MDWLKQEHLDALKDLLPELPDGRVKRRVRELVLGLSTELAHQLALEATAVGLEEPIAPLTENELQDIQALLAKGLLHNGLVPELSVTQVGRALQVTTELLQRAHVGALDLDDQAGLEWVFDVAYGEADPDTQTNVRRLEMLVRAGLGLTTRMLHYTPINELPA